MNLISYSDSYYSLLPPAVALIMAVLTRRVLLSLACGIIIGALFLLGGHPVNTIEYIGRLIKQLVRSDGGWNSWNINILAFLLLLGAMTGMMQINGSTRAFADWARKRIKTHRNASVMVALLCFVVFIDDYFHSLAVGNIAKPVTDKAKMSRAKLAYLLDSTAAPMCVIMPISSWGAYIIALIGGILAAHGMESSSSLNAFISIIPLNFYAIFALLTAFIVAYFNINIGSMAEHESRATQGHLYDESKGTPAGSAETFSATVKGSPWGLLLPLIVLALTTFAAFLWTGYQSADLTGPINIFSLLKNTDVAKSLVIGGVVGCLVSIVFSLVMGVKLPALSKTVVTGAYSMIGAILVLLFAWSIASVISDMHTGAFLASLVKKVALPGYLLPVLLFVLSGIMAFATGTSWGTFGVMLPIAGEIAAASYPELMYPILAAVLAGSVFGDHCSPISDTTILSSTGAGCHHIDHVTTQLPYALFTALITCISYIIVGATDSSLLAIGVGVVLLVGTLMWFNRRPQSASASLTQE